MAEHKKDSFEKEEYDRPEQYKTSNNNLQEKFKDDLHTDAIPVEDLREQALDEKDKEHSKDTSSSEKKYEGF
ncbi:hypothetical protein [Heyndrickxia acidicola]|uniref:Uncharacterized protein n=1 Tax=Heyndrickxia acidicola TaxID=209389 RepID=A0ABU6MI11_9BACI|nr:hypothetical protein [Heyndrickxia acidicola]MED1204069.1 hypothetical protein [Heyndrickxia acidicola]